MTAPHALKDELTVRRLFPTSPYFVMVCTNPNCRHEFMFVLPDDDDGVAELEKNRKLFGKPWNALHGFDCPFCHEVYGKMQYAGNNISKEEIEAFKAVGGEVKEVDITEDIEKGRENDNSL